MTTARLWAWPAVSGDLTPPGPAFYVDWPSWDKYRQTELGEESHPFLTPVMLEDPPNFIASLKSLLALARDGGPIVAETPFSSQEIGGIRSAILGQSQPILGPYHLILALGHLVRHEVRAAHALVQRAIIEKSDLLGRLTGETLDQPRLIALSDQPDPAPLTAAAWLNLARPYLKAGDLLWPAYGGGPDFTPLEGLEADSSGFFAWPGSA